MSPSSAADGWQGAYAPCLPNHQMSQMIKVSIRIRIHATAHTPGVDDVADGLSSAVAHEAIEEVRDPRWQATSRLLRSPRIPPPERADQWRSQKLTRAVASTMRHARRKICPRDQPRLMAVTRTRYSWPAPNGTLAILVGDRPPSSPA